MMKKIPFVPGFASQRRLFRRREPTGRAAAVYLLTMLAAAVAAWMLLEQAPIA